MKMFAFAICLGAVSLAEYTDFFSGFYLRIEVYVDSIDIEMPIEHGHFFTFESTLLYSDSTIATDPVFIHEWSVAYGSDFYLFIALIFRRFEVDTCMKSTELFW